MSEDNTKELLNEIKTSSPPKQKPLFTQVQIAEQVRDFIYAYRNGHIRLKPKKEEEIKYEYINLDRKQPSSSVLESFRQNKKQYDNKEENREIKYALLELIRICEGTRKVTDEERYQKMLELFDRILTLQSNGRLEGKIQSYDLNRRIDELEEKVTGLVGRFDVFNGNSV